MQVIDDRGRVFGLVNLIDGLVAVVALGLIPLSYGVFLMFRPPTPRIIQVSPEQLPENQTDLDRPRVRIRGENFREALLPKFGETPSAGFLVQDSQHAEVIVPPLAAGTYDLSLSDGGRVLSSMSGALTIVAPLPPVRVAAPAAKSAVASVVVRFIAEPEVIGVMKVGDVDVGGAAAPAEAASRAVLAEIGADRETASALIVAESVVGRNSFQIQRPVLVFTCTLRVPVVDTPSGWSYRDRPVKVGAPFAFVTMSGAMGGSIINVTVRTQK